MIARICLTRAFLTGGLLLSAWNAWGSQGDTTDAGHSKKSTTSGTAAEPTKFIRVIHDAHERPLALETATGHYVRSVNGKTCSVDLIGAIHIADKKYYEALNERFKQYDAVLFELVMPEDASVAHVGKGKSRNPIGKLQETLPEILDLDYQLKRINYLAKNFVHADLSPDAMAKAIKSRGDTGASVTLKVMMDLLSETGRQAENRAKKNHGVDFSELQLLAALIDPDRPMALKRLMADQMEMIETGTGLGATLDTILVKDRNSAAIKVLGDQLRKGTMRIAIFYGAAHMPDFDHRLTSDLKFTREGMTWDRAWDMTGKPTH
jgi:hypothetical protein